MSDEIKVNARTLDGRSREIKILASATVLQLKQRLEKDINMPASRQRIIYQGRVLKDTHVLGNGLNGEAVHVVDSVPPTQVIH